MEMLSTIFFSAKPLENENHQMFLACRTNFKVLNGIIRQITKFSVFRKIPELFKNLSPCTPSASVLSTLTISEEYLIHGKPFPDDTNISI